MDLLVDSSSSKLHPVKNPVPVENGETIQVGLELWGVVAPSYITPSILFLQRCIGVTPTIGPVPKLMIPLRSYATPLNWRNDLVPASQSISFS